MSIKKLLKIKRGLVSLNNFRKFVGNEIFLNSIKNDFIFQILNELPSGKILVLAPHPDDEILGCSGAISMHKKAGAHVRIIVLTDGSGGSEAHLSPAQRKVLVAKREKEAKQTAEAIGAKDLIFWRYKDKGLVLTRALTKLITNEVGTFSPDIIYVPSFLDPHPDHRETAKVFASALRNLKKFECRIFSYETWLPVYANRLVVIDKEIERKKQALKKYQSQLECRDYVEGILGLNRYRGGMFGAGKYAEGFFETDKELYLQLLKISSLEK